MSHPYIRPVVGAAVLACAASLTHAAPATADDAVVVTASRFQSSSIRQPIATQVITADEIRDSAATTVAEVLHKLGGVHTRINFVGISDAPLDLRGFGMTGNENTLVLLNGQRISENEQSTARLSSIPLNAIERIEILRGAGAVLYGGGATGGTINIITRSPVAAATGGGVSATVGGDGLRDLRADAEAGGAGWGANLSVQRYTADNYRQHNRTEQESGSGELRFGDKDAFIALNVGASSQKALLPGARTEAQLASAPREATTPNDYMNSRSELFSLRGEKRLGELTLAVDLGQRDKTVRFFNDFGFGFTSLQDAKVKVRTLSPRLLWAHRFGGMDNRLTVGADWSDWTYDSSTASGFGNRRELGAQRNRALYFRNELAVTASTRLSVGARRETVDQEQEESLTPLPKTAVSHRLSAYELALQHELGRGFSAYGRLGSSFRVGNIDDNRCWGAPCAPLLKPQRSKDRELGLNWQDGGASVRASLFEIDLTDEIHYNALTFTNMNLSPTRRQGLELEGKLAFGAFDLTGRYANTRARFRAGVYGGVDVAGKVVPLVPEERLGLAVGWQIVPSTRLTVNLDHVGSQRYDNDQANRFRVMPAYTVVDAKLSHQLGRWRIAGGINNLFDKAYYSYAIVNGAGTSFSAYPEARRNAYLSGEYRW